MYPEVIVAHVHLASPAHLDHGLIERIARRMSIVRGCSCDPTVQVNACEECGDIEKVDIVHLSRCRISMALSARFN
jgi:hypothetical protein